MQSRSCSPLSYPAPTSYLIFCFLFSVTVEPSWWAVGCCEEYTLKPEEFQPERHRAKVSLIEWERERRRGEKRQQLTTTCRIQAPHSQSHPGKNVTHTHNMHKASFWSQHTSEWLQYFKTLPDPCRASFFVSSDKIAHQELDMNNRQWWVEGEIMMKAHTQGH